MTIRRFHFSLLASHYPLLYLDALYEQTEKESNQPKGGLDRKGSSSPRFFHTLAESEILTNRGSTPCCHLFRDLVGLVGQWCGRISDPAAVF